LPHKYEGTILTTFFKQPTQEFESMKNKIMQKMNEQLRAMNIFKGASNMTKAECD